MPKRTHIPRNIMKHIAEALISKDERAKRSDKRWPRSKSAILRDLMSADPTLNGRVYKMAAEFKTGALLSDMAKDGLTLHTEPIAPDDGAQPFLCYPFDWLIHYTCADGSAGRCHLCGGFAITWLDGKYLCQTHQKRCVTCQAPADWGNSSTFFCSTHVPDPAPGTELMAGEKSFFTARDAKRLTT
jgi:hypothetical protein